MSKDYMAILNLSENETDIRSLTSNRPIASIPFASRYRVIDFIMSNIVNFGIDNVGVFTESNSRSLADHLGTGKSWDLNRKIDGLFIFNHGLIDFSAEDSKLLKNNMEYIHRSKQENVILASSYMVCNIDFAKVARAHEKSCADVTVVYTHTDKANTEFINCNTLDIDGDGYVKRVGRNIGARPSQDISMEMFLMKKSLLVDLLYRSAGRRDKTHNFNNIIYESIDEIKMNTYKFDGFVACINTVSSYYSANMKTLDLKVSNELFRSDDRPIFTKIKDEPPTSYDSSSSVSDSLIADGCKISGNVKNSILGRYVYIEEGATVEDCIILQNVRVHKGAVLSHVIVDKNVDIEANSELKGNSIFPLVIEKKNIFN